jgi:predicted aspartyl protease
MHSTSARDRFFTFQFHRWLGAMVLLGFVLFSLGCSSISDSEAAAIVSVIPPKRTILAADRVALPVVTIDGCMFVEARINGAGPFRLLVDTGATPLALPIETAQKAKLLVLDTFVLDVNAIAGTSQGHTAPIARLESGGLALEDFYAVVFSEKEWAYTRVGLPACDGVLGVAPLGDLILEVDAPKNAVNVVRSGSQHYPAEAACDFVWDSGVPWVNASVDGKTFPVMLDTGARSAVVALPQLNAVPLRFPEVKTENFSIGLGVAKLPIARSQIAGDVHIGPAILHNPPIQTQQSAAVGWEMLRRWKFALDQHARKIYFLGPETVANWPDERPPELQVKLGLLCRPEFTDLRVLEVEPDSAAARAGIHPGDLITQINGEHAVNFSQRIVHENLSLAAAVQASRGEIPGEVQLTIDTERIPATPPPTAVKSDVPQNETPQQKAARLQKVSDAAHQRLIQAVQAVLVPRQRVTDTLTTAFETAKKNGSPKSLFGQLLRGAEENAEAAHHLLDSMREYQKRPDARQEIAEPMAIATAQAEVADALLAAIKATMTEGPLH